MHCLLVAELLGTKPRVFVETTAVGIHITINEDMAVTKQSMGSTLSALKMFTCTPNNEKYASEHVGESATTNLFTVTVCQHPSGSSYKEPCPQMQRPFNCKF